MNISVTEWAEQRFVFFLELNSFYPFQQIFVDHSKSRVVGNYRIVQHLCPILDIKVKDTDVYAMTENKVI